MQHKTYAPFNRVQNGRFVFDRSRFMERYEKLCSLNFLQNFLKLNFHLFCVELKTETAEQFINSA